MIDEKYDDAKKEDYQEYAKIFYEGFVSDILGL